MNGESFGERIGAVRAAAFDEAALVLRELGFAKVRERRWSGRLGSGRSADVELPPDFPEKLPSVYMAGARPRDQVAHVDENQKVCVASDSGTLIDVARVRDVIVEVLKKADNIIDGEPAGQVEDIGREFLGYWNGENWGLLSIVDPQRATGEATMVRFRADTAVVLADDSEAARSWLDAAGHRAGQSRRAWFVRLSAFVPLPAPGKKLRLGEVLSFLRRALPEQEYAATEAWLLDRGLPSILVFSSPVPRGGEAVYAMLVPAPEIRGFRPGRAPNRNLLTAAGGEPVKRVNVQRADPEYLLQRAGGTTALRMKTVLLAGCGSVGSHLATALAAMGVGKLVLVDSENLTPDNFHRHVLGATHVGEPKATSLSAVLLARFPHLRVDARAATVEDLLAQEESVLDGVDLVVLALGDETLERRLCALLRRQKRLVHVWLEPYGVGGHVLTGAATGRSGCFTCLFRRDVQYGLVNESSLVEPNQKFQRTLGGCAGTFTPFGVLDAERVAIEAAREVGRVLEGNDPGPRLLTWAGSTCELVAAGFRPSKRRLVVADGSVIAGCDFVKLDCECCGASAK